MKRLDRFESQRKEVAGDGTGIHSLAGQELLKFQVVRIGIATGLVVVGDLIAEGATQRHAVVGETPNLVGIGFAASCFNVSGIIDLAQG